jgi:hypothetical protein
MHKVKYVLNRYSSEDREEDNCALKGNQVTVEFCKNGAAAG